MTENKITVLVAEDEVDFRTIMTFWLESKGYAVIPASDGRIAVELVKERKPDVVFLDLNMPGMDGVQAFKNIRKFDKDIPVIIISAHIGTPRANEIMSLGVSGIFSKEADFEKEFSLLEVVLRGNKKIKGRIEQKQEALPRGSQAEKIAAIRQFAVGLTDEMNNILVVISGKLKIVLEQKTIAKNIREDLDVVNNCIGRLSKITNRIIKFAMNLPHKFENLNINEVIESVFTLLTYHKIYSTAISIEKDLNKNIPLIKSDFNQLQEVFLDLFLNAYEAMAGEGKLSVRTSNFQNHHIEIKISDTGCKKKEWTDFDLLICRKIINNLNGSVDIENQSKSGVTVIIRLPVV